MGSRVLAVFHGSSDYGNITAGTGVLWLPTYCIVCPSMSKEGKSSQLD